MRKSMIFGTVIAAVFAVAALATVMPNSGMPNPQREYNQRTNCHLGYDIVIERRNRKWSVSPAMDSWAVEHETAARDRKPCPAMPDDLSFYSVNWLMMTPQGRASAQKFADQQNDPVALSELGLAYISGKYSDVQPQQGIALLQRAASLGDRAATYTTATLYSSGLIDGTKNHKEGFRLMEQAAAAGHVDAIFRSGIYHQEGIGTRKDPQRAFAAYQRAAESGHLYATIMAFEMINSGQVRKDWDLAYRLGRNAAEAGEVYGMLIAASSLLQGPRPADHQDEILYWLDQAIALGDPSIRTKVTPIRAQAVALFRKPSAPPAYQPRVRRACPMKTTCVVNHYSGLQSCTTSRDYWSDCDG